MIHRYAAVAPLLHAKSLSLRVFRWLRGFPRRRARTRAASPRHTTRCMCVGAQGRNGRNTRNDKHLARVRRVTGAQQVRARARAPILPFLLFFRERGSSRESGVLPGAPLAFAAAALRGLRPRR